MYNVFENKMARKMFGPKGEKVRGQRKNGPTGEKGRGKWKDTHQVCP